MSEPFLAEIRMVGFNFAPRGYANCDGQILPINQNQSLYSLLGTTYGGDGRTSFALPDMRSRAPTHPDRSSMQLGSRGGEETHTLNIAEMPSHTHSATASFDQGTSLAPEDQVFSSKARRATDIYTDPSNLVSMDATTITPVGGSTPHENMQPYLAVRFIIALQGLFPSRN